MVGVLVALVPTVITVIGALINTYYKTLALAKELHDNSKSDAQTRDDLNKLYNQVQLQKAKIAEIEDARDEDISSLKGSMETLINKMDSLFERKKQYIDTEIDKVDSRLNQEIKRIESLRREDISRFDSLLDAMSQSFTKYNEKLTTISTDMAEIKGTIRSIFNNS
jgi:DNA repair exonuclease SbcCD ATPase subunit